MFFVSNLFFTSLMNMRTSLCLSNVVCFPTCVLRSHEIFVSTITKRTQTQNETTYTACSNTGIQFYQDEIMCIPGGMTSSYNCVARARRETRGELILGIPRAVLVFLNIGTKTQKQLYTYQKYLFPDQTYFVSESKSVVSMSKHLF